ncbi:MAG: hypothetical protein ACRDQ0_05815 [Pseudonocardia sp.]
MRRTRWARVAAVLAAGTLPLVVAGCTTVVPGTATAAPPPGSTVPATPDTTESGRGGLDADVLPDECLLNAAEFGDLVGVPVRPPEQGTVERDDGSSSASCVATAGTDPVAMINVYAVRGTTPADHVRAGGGAGRHELPGVGEAAVVIDTATGPTLQLASTEYLVTILVSGRTPPDDAWRAAAEAALSRLPG